MARTIVLQSLLLRSLPVSLTFTLAAGCAGGRPILVDRAPPAMVTPSDAPRVPAQAHRELELPALLEDDLGVRSAPNSQPSVDADTSAAISPSIEAAPLIRSTPLQSGFYNPMPGGVMAGYRADT